MKRDTQINWTLSANDFAVIVKIAERATALAKRLHVVYPEETILRDLQACHANGCALDLEGLLAAGDGDFGHDVFGINKHLNRETGKLEGFFIPRLASRY
jgi:hypothetical protein